MPHFFEEGNARAEHITGVVAGKFPTVSLTNGFNLYVPYIMRDRIRQLIYLDAVILENGQSVFTPLPVLREAWKWGARPDFRQQGCRTRPSRRAK